MALFHVPNPAKEAEKAVNRVIKPARDAALKAINAVRDGALKKVWDLRHQTWDAVQAWKGDIAKAGHSAEGLVTGAAHKAQEELETAGREAHDGIKAAVAAIPDHAEAAVAHAMSALAEAVTEHGLALVRGVVATTHEQLNKLAASKPGLVDAINDLGGSLEIGPITLEYTNFYTRTELVAGVLDQYINEPPELRRGPIIDMVRALGPDNINLGVSVQVVALVVGSKELGVGGGLNDISIDLFAEIGDVILEAMGVPE